MNSVTPKEATMRRGNTLRSIKLLSYEITAAFDLLFVSAIVLGPLATPWFYARARITVVTTRLAERGAMTVGAWPAWRESRSPGLFHPMKFLDKIDAQKRGQSALGLVRK